MKGLNSDLTACFNRITYNRESFMLSTSSCPMLSQGFSPNSHQLTFHQTHGDVSMAEDFPAFPTLLLLSTTKHSEVTMSSHRCTLCSLAVMQQISQSPNSYGKSTRFVIVFLESFHCRYNVEVHKHYS